jgi:5-methylcytosine-specific restriction endonuclease McrA
MSTVLNRSVLCLNRNHQPLQVTAVWRAICLLVGGKALALDHWQIDWQGLSWDAWGQRSAQYAITPPTPVELLWIRTCQQKFLVPEVIRLLDHQKQPVRRFAPSRANIFQRDEHRCLYCGERLPASWLTIDHVIPRTQGGKNTWDNLATACSVCNSLKGGRTPEQASMRLRILPSKPAWQPPWTKNPLPSWKSFLNS